LVYIEIKIERYAIMKCLELFLALIIFLCPVHGYPLHASNGAVNCTVFGEFKDPYTIVESNGDQNIVLNVDVALVRANAKEGGPIQVSYSLVDGNDKTYQTRGEFTRSLQPGRQLLGFAVPRETIPKTLIVDPSGDPSGGNRFTVNFDEVANATNGNVTILYYGVLNSKVNSNLKSIDYDIGIANNDTRTLPLSSKNFSLIDQWGWRYASLAYNAYTNDGFQDRKLMPNETARIKLSFGFLSPLSRPSWLVYEYSNASSVMINIDPEAGLLQYTGASKGNSSCDCCGGATESAPTTLAGSIKATKERLQKVRENL
jgi:hypothetical protein